jgi:hypothetical protein
MFIVMSLMGHSGLSYTSNRSWGRREIVLFSANRPLLVTVIELFKALGALGIRLQGVFNLAGHSELGAGNICVNARRNSGKNGGA